MKPVFAKLASLATIFAIVIAPVALAAPGDNVGTGDIAGDAAAIDSSDIFNLTTKTLALVKRAFDAAGDPIPTGSVLPAGTEVRFMIYVSNDTPVAVNDLSVQDILDNSVFAYQTDSIKVDNSVAACAADPCTVLEEDAIFDAVELTADLTDLIDTDAVSYDGGTFTIDAGNQNVANAEVVVAADTVWAMTFTVTMQ